MGALLQFPDRAKGRKRQRQSIGAMGDCSLLITRDEPTPPNVARFVRARNKADPTPDSELALLLAGSIFAVLPKDAREQLLDELRCLDLGYKDRRAAEVLAIIERRGR